jgi:hypothetical protein
VLQLQNETSLSAERAVLLDPTGTQHWVVVIKATYTIDPSGRSELAEEQEPVCLAPVFSGTPGQSSLLRETELTYDHPGTDVIFNASAHSRAGPVPSVDVHVEVGPVRKALRVYGERAWARAAFGFIPSRPIPFTTLPICYERAFGGSAGPDGPHDERNPIGCGLKVNPGQLTDSLLPNVEDPSVPLRSRSDRPAPAGLGAISTDWSPRRTLAGTFDDRWQQTKLPLWPDDFDPRYFCAAATGLHAAAPLQGGEPVTLVGLSPEVRRFRLPREVLTVDTWIGSRHVRQSSQLDRVIIEPDARRLIMVWRSSLRCGPRFRDIVRTRVGQKLRVAK